MKRHIVVEHTKVFPYECLVEGCTKRSPDLAGARIHGRYHQNSGREMLPFAVLEVLTNITAFIDSGDNVSVVLKEIKWDNPLGKKTPCILCRINFNPSLLFQRKK